MSVKIAINGALGRMGRRIYALAKDNTDAEVVKLIDWEKHEDMGSIVDGITVTSDKTDLAGIDAVIDFSLPESAMIMLDCCVKNNVPIVIGCTGLSAEQIAKVEEAAKKIPVVRATNMSVSVNLFFKILEDVAKTLQGYDVKMHEAHHIHKMDAPSGTAKTLADVINKAGYSIKYEDVDVTREGEIIGDHEVVFESAIDKFEIRHHAKTRDIFADGAVKAGVWIADRPVKLYDMQEVLFG